MRYKISANKLTFISQVRLIHPLDVDQATVIMQPFAKVLFSVVVSQ